MTDPVVLRSFGPVLLAALVSVVVAVLVLLSRPKGREPPVS